MFGIDANDGYAEGFLRIYYFDGDPALNDIFHGRCGVGYCLFVIYLNSFIIAIIFTPV